MGSPVIIVLFADCRERLRQSGGLAARPVERVEETPFESVREAIARHLGELTALEPDALRQDRYDRFRSLGVVAGGK